MPGIRVLLLLDALDEVPKDGPARRCTQVLLEDLQHPSVSMVVSTRPIDEQLLRVEGWHECRCVSVAGFGEEQVEAFVRMAAKRVGQEDDGEHVLEVLRGSDDLRRHARIPVQLEMLCNIFLQRARERGMGKTSGVGGSDIGGLASGSSSEVVASPIRGDAGMESLLGIYDLQLGENLLRQDKAGVLGIEARQQLLRGGGSRLLEKSCFPSPGEQRLWQEMNDCLEATVHLARAISTQEGRQVTEWTPLTSELYGDAAAA